MIIFLGAGASKPFDIPVTCDFAIEAIDFISKQPEYKEHSKFLEQILNTFKNEFDLEILLTLLDDLSKENTLEVISPITTRFILEQPKPKEYINEPEIKKLSQRLFTTVTDFMRVKITQQIAEKKSDIINIYDNLFGGLIEAGCPFNRYSGDGRIKFPTLSSVVTTNYDLCLETYFNEKRYQFENNIQKLYGQDYFSLQLLDSPHFIPQLLKLHGSLNLFYLPDGNIIQLQLHHQKYDDLEKSSARSLGVNIKKEVILYPTESGADRRIIESPFTDLYFRFRKAFEADPKLLIIGFSMRDRTICSILQYTLVNRGLTNAKIILLDPNADKIIKSLLNKGFDKLAGIICPIGIGLGAVNLIPQLKEAFRRTGFPG